jgi:DeoR/GlpR family transcriptional regulator of sugar metabolism
MLPEQRRRQILEQVESGETTSIVDLSQKYAVSEMTIRRDLKLLEEQGQLKRTHGGALPVSAPAVEPRYAAKQKLNAQNKAAIARYAAEHLVAEGDIIILEGGTTITRMAQFLTVRHNLTVVTNGLYTANELRHLLPHATVICTGGILRDVSFTFVGPLVEQFFREFHANTVFVSATGLTLEAGLTDPNMLEVQVKKAMIAAARRVVVLLDSSKFGVQSLSTILRPEGANLLVTDDGAPPAIVDALRARGIEIRQIPAAVPHR